MKLEKRIKKWEKIKCGKKRSKGKKQEAGNKKKLLGGKQEKDKLRKNGRKGQKKNTVKRTFAERQCKADATACMTKPEESLGN